MSDRDDIDVINSDDSLKSESSTESASEEFTGIDIYSSSEKLNQAIRQNPLTHSGEKPVKNGFLEKLKRAFSTEDTYSTDIADNSDTQDGGLINDEETSIFTGFVNRFKKHKSDTEENVLQKVENSESVTVSGEISEITKKSENSPQNPKNIDKENSEAVKTEVKTVTEEKVEKTEKISAEIEREEKVLEIQSEEQQIVQENSEEFDTDEEEEFAMINAFLNGESIEDMQFSDKKSESESTAELTEITIETKTEINIEVTAENVSAEKTEESISKPEPEQSEQVESKSEPEQSEQVESKSEPEQSEQIQSEESDKLEAAAEDEAIIDLDEDDEEISLDDENEPLFDESDDDYEYVEVEVSEESTKEEKSEATTKSEEPTEVKSEEAVKSEESTEIKSEETTKSEEPTEIKSEETTKSEEPTEIKSEETPKSEESTEVKSEETPKSEEPTEVKSEETPKSEESTEVKSEETVKSEESTEVKSEETTKSEEENLEVVSEEEYFTTTENPENTKKSEESTAEKNEVSEVTENSVQENTDKTEESAEDKQEKEEKSEAETKAEEVEIEIETVSDENIDESEFIFQTDSEENEESETVAEKVVQTAETVKETTEESVPEVKSEETEKATTAESETTTADVTSAETNSKGEKAVGKFKNWYSQTKDKLVKMWNTKEDVSATESKSEDSNTVTENPVVTASADEKLTESSTEVTEVSVEAVEENTSEKSDSGTSVINLFKDDDVEELITEDTTSGEETEESRKRDFENGTPIVMESNYNELLYGQMFDAGSEVDSFRREIYGLSEDDDLSEDDNSDGYSEYSGNSPMRVIRSTSAVTSELDREHLRSSLNVIDRESAVQRTPDVLTEEQKRKFENQQKVIEKLDRYEEQIAEQREALQAERQEKSDKVAKSYEERFGTASVREIEINDYTAPDVGERIKVKIGNFSESVNIEYGAYANYSLMNEVKMLPHKNDSGKNSNGEGTSKGKSATGGERRVTDESTDDIKDKLEKISRKLDNEDFKNPDSLEYRSEEDESKVRDALRKEFKSAKLRWNVSWFITLVTFVLFLFGKKFGVGNAEAESVSSMRWFASLNIILYGIAMYNCRDILNSGFNSIKKLKVNSDTGLTVATVAVTLQSLLAIITPEAFLKQTINLYTILVMLAFATSSLGNYMNADRTLANFRFVTDSMQKYVGKLFHDQRMVATLLSGTRNDKTELVFQRKTSFLKHFIKLSRSTDPGENLAKKFTLPTIVFSVVLGIIYGIISKSFPNAISSMCVLLCTSVPMCSKALGAVPLNKLAKSSLKNQSMVSGYSAVENFADSAAIMIDAKELYPEGSVELTNAKTFIGSRVDDALMAAAGVMIAAGGAASGMFDSLLNGRHDTLPTPESVLYEDGKGIIGWVHSKRVLIGNRKLLEIHGVPIRLSPDYEESVKSENKEILYIAYGGELAAVFHVRYTANRRVADALKRMEENGMSLLIRTTDVNITAERIAKDFGIFHRNIKILEQKNSNVIRDEMIGKEKSSPAFVATKGGVTAFGRAVSGCIQTKRNISLSLAIQIVGVLLGLLVIMMIVLFAGVSRVGAIAWFISCTVWVIATLIAPYVVKNFQK